MCKVSVLIADVSPLEDPTVYNKIYEGITDFRKEKVDKLRFESGKRLSVGAEYILLYMLKKWGISKNEIEYEYGENGKPYLKNKNIYFNVSHSGTMVACAVSDVEVGIDIEKIKDTDYKIAKRFFAENENTLIDNQADDELKRDMFFRIWTMKESFIKATGLGMATDLRSFDMVIDDEIKVCQGDIKEKFGFKEIEAPEGYKCTVCTKGVSLFDVDILDWSIRLGVEDVDC